jgi:hypothetical protein
MSIVHDRVTLQRQEAALTDKTVNDLIDVHRIIDRARAIVTTSYCVDAVQQADGCQGQGHACSGR